MKKYHKESKESALERFNKQYPNATIKSVKTTEVNKGQYETIIKAEIIESYGDTWS